MAGISATGFDLKRLADILADATADLEGITDPVTGDTLRPDFSGADPAMQIALVPLTQIADAWETMQEAYDQFDPDKANEASLAALVQLNGLKQLDASPSSVPVAMAGTPYAVIPPGQVITDDNATYQWTTDAEVVLDGAGAGATSATCTVTGPVTLAPTKISTPLAGWASFTTGDVVAGRNKETPAQLRVRRNQSTMAPASGPIDAIRANLADTPGVTYARVYQNVTLTVDGRGIPAKTVAPVVVGGTDADIAAVLLARTGITAAFYGTSTYTLYDQNNEAYTLAWTRPAPQDIYLYIEITVTNPAQFPADGVTQIKNNIVAYAQGGAPALGITDGFGDEGFGPGATVERSRLYTPLNFVPGHKVKTLYLGTAPGPTGTADIPSAWNGYPRFTVANINVVPVP